MHPLPLEDLSPPNLNVNTVVQGVPFHAGFHPNSNSLVDSPMQAYNENMSDSDLMVNTVLLSESFFTVNSYMLARFSLAKSAFQSYFKPSLHMDNAFFLSPAIIFDTPTMFELYGEKMLFLQSKKKAKLNTVSNCFQQVGAIVQFDYQDESGDLSLVGQNRKSSNGSETPLCTTQVRRSSRCNKYDGFKPTNFSDSKKAKSKVKPRKGTASLKIISDEEAL
jgi:hypothetical protein